MNANIVRSAFLALFVSITSPLVIAQLTPSNIALAPTPPMGFASWNHYFCDYNEKTIRDQADALVSSGMRDLGYKYVLIQECIAQDRNADGTLIIDPQRFPHGLKPLVDYIHDRGLKAGIYTDIGEHTCNQNPRYEGSYGHEDVDAASFATWGFDLIEEDYCNKPSGHSGRELYERFAASIKKTGRPILFYACTSGAENPWEWAQGVAEVWRTDKDVHLGGEDTARWERVVLNFESNARHAVFNAPGSWNDPDMLDVGNRGLTDEESRSQFLMWAVAAAPLWASTDLTQMSDHIRAILTNREVIAVDQDPLGASAVKVQEDSLGLEVWAKPLRSRASGVDAVLLLNLLDRPAKIHVDWHSLGLEQGASARDLLTHSDLGRFPAGYEALVPAHGAVLLKIAGRFAWQQGTTYEAEWPGNRRDGATHMFACNQCSSGYAVSLLSSQRNVPSSIEFTHIDVPAGGNYWMLLSYLNAPNRATPIELQINDSPPTTVNLSVELIGQKMVPIMLKAGENTIRISNHGQNLLDIDMIRIAEAQH